ncbi:hypothetical protein HOLleu_14879 [Holothuria leucospilota]|uniref:EGF-like domain-containing protein n=1 Tax=Holothuria leucospilota TaxID=206669 RepID=A0A9Q1C9E9_HOLLE|nr:hypothetical protein HOLleu_14879 [Holothuria leucospilota]
MDLQWSYFLAFTITVWNLHLADAAGCDSNPCQNGGVCFDQPNDGFFCLCVLGFTGLTCIGDVPTTQPPAVETTTLTQTTTQATTTPVITTPTAPTAVVTTAQSSSTESQQTTAKMTSKSASTEGVLPTESKDGTSHSVDSTNSLTNTEGGTMTSSFITAKMITSKVKPTKDTSPKGAPAKGSVGDKQGSLLWLLLLVLLVLLLIGGVVTVWAVKRSAKNHAPPPGMNPMYQPVQIE